MRVVIEHVFAILKKFKIISEKYRKTYSVIKFFKSQLIILKFIL